MSVPHFVSPVVRAMSSVARFFRRGRVTFEASAEDHGKVQQTNVEGVRSERDVNITTRQE